MRSSREGLGVSDKGRNDSCTHDWREVVTRANSNNIIINDNKGSYKNSSFSELNPPNKGISLKNRLLYTITLSTLPSIPQVIIDIRILLSLPHPYRTNIRWIHFHSPHPHIPHLVHTHHHLILIPCPYRTAIPKRLLLLLLNLHLPPIIHRHLNRLLHNLVLLISLWICVLVLLGPQDLLVLVFGAHYKIITNLIGWGRFGDAEIV